MVREGGRVASNCVRTQTMTAHIEIPSLYSPDPVGRANSGKNSHPSLISDRQTRAFNTAAERSNRKWSGITTIDEVYDFPRQTSRGRRQAYGSTAAPACALMMAPCTLSSRATASVLSGSIDTTLTSVWRASPRRPARA